jgi:hypothetical protein
MKDTIKSSIIWAGRRLKKGLVRLGYHTRPAFIIIGAQKAGTSSLFAMLSQHPQIVAPARKELHFFDDGEMKYGDFSAYHDLFPLPYALNSGKITFEATPSYLYHPQCAQRICEYSPEMRIIAILRDPVSRAYSGWNMYRSLAGSTDPDQKITAEYRSFEDAVADEIKVIEQTEWSNNPRAYVKRGLYAEQLQRYFNFFPRESCLILDHYDLQFNPEACLREICLFLRINERFHFTVERRHLSSYASSLPQKAADSLRSFYAPHNNDLFALLGREFKW